jgi:hypothetical protein
MFEASPNDAGREHARTADSFSGFVRCSGRLGAVRCHGPVDRSAGSGA